MLLVLVEFWMQPGWLRWFFSLAQVVFLMLLAEELRDYRPFLWWLIELFCAFQLYQCRGGHSLLFCFLCVLLLGSMEDDFRL